MTFRFNTFTGVLSDGYKIQLVKTVQSLYALLTEELLSVPSFSTTHIHSAKPCNAQTAEMQRVDPTQSLYSFAKSSKSLRRLSHISQYQRSTP